MPLTTTQARAAAHESWARTSNRTARTAPGRAALYAKFEDQVDPHREMSPHDRALAAEAARRAHFLRMAAKSAQVRRAKSKAKQS